MAMVVMMVLLFRLLLLFILASFVVIAVFILIKLSKRDKERRNEHRKERRQEERLAFGNEMQIRIIDRQLEGVDRAHILSLTPLLYQKSVEELRALLDSRQITHVELVAYYLLRIRDLDQAPGGTNAIMEVNPRAIETARGLDQQPQGVSLVKSPLHGIPVLLKDNINTCDMPTSAGSIALQDWIPNEDAPVVRKLRNAGAIILGKTNLSEMSFYMSDLAPSGYSSKKGQTLSPFAPLRLSAGGSSTGSGVAMAMDLAALSYGTETIGSIVSPASANSVVGYKPSHSAGGISGRGVIPITARMDTVGPITKCVKDAALAYEAACETPTEQEIKWDPDYLKGKALRLERTLEMDPYLEECLVRALNSMEVYVGVAEGTVAYDAPKVLEADFERCINAYLEQHHAPVRSLREWVAFNAEDPANRMRYGQSYMEEAVYKKRAEMLSESEIEQKIASALQRIAGVTHPRAEGFDAWVFIGSAGAPVACLAGAPEVTVPFGVAGPEQEPVGVTFIGRPGGDASILEMAYSFEQRLGYRVLPDK